MTECDEKSEAQVNFAVLCSLADDDEVEYLARIYRALGADPDETENGWELLRELAAMSARCRDLGFPAEKLWDFLGRCDWPEGFNEVGTARGVVNDCLRAGMRALVEDTWRDEP